MSKFSFAIPGTGFVGIPGYRFSPDKGLVAIKEANLNVDSSQTIQLFQGEMKIGNFLFPIDPVVQVSRARKIVKTDLAGFSGSIKEDMAFDDYRVNITAVLQNEESDEYPEYLVSTLNKELEKPGSLPVYNKLLSAYNVSNIAIENVEYETPEGYGAQAIVRISAFSDSLPELILIKMLQS